VTDSWPGGSFMLLNRRLNPYVLVSVGLLGMTLYALAMRFGHPDILSNDFVRGVWYGLCLGVQLLGLYRLRNSGTGHAA
jgi:hypothetical protein